MHIHFSRGKQYSKVLSFSGLLVFCSCDPILLIYLDIFLQVCANIVILLWIGKRCPGFEHAAVYSRTTVIRPRTIFLGNMPGYHFAFDSSSIVIDSLQDTYTDCTCMCRSVPQNLQLNMDVSALLRPWRSWPRQIPFVHYKHRISFVYLCYQ